MRSKAYFDHSRLRVPAHRSSTAIVALTSLISTLAAAPRPDESTAATPVSPVTRENLEQAAGQTTLPELLILGETLGDPQDKPVSAAFLTDRDVEAMKIREPQDVARVAPNMSATDSGSRSFGDVYTTRGLSNTVFFGAPATTIYVDDVPFGETFTYAQQLSALNSIEVLRGPQPGIVGRNSYGGLINIRSRRPGTEFEGEGNFTMGSYDRYAGDLWMMGPINDQWGFRIGGQYDTRDGYLYNPITGERVDDQDHWGGNGGLFWKPAPGWEVSLTAAYDEFDGGAPRLTSLFSPGFHEVTSNVEGEQFLKTDNQALRIAYENDRWKFLSVTSRRNWDLGPYIADLDFSPQPFGYTELYQDQEIWSQEFRFSSNDPNAVFEWTAGAYASTGEVNGTGFRDTLTQNGAVFSDTRHTIEEDMFALFGNIAYKGWNPVTLRAGMRADWVDRSIHQNHLIVMSGNPFPATQFDMEDDWFHFTPSAGLDWQINPNVMGYIKSAYAFKPGGFSAYSDDPRYIPFDEEKSWSSEIGLKTKWMDGRLTANVAAFYNDIDDYQVERSIDQLGNYAVFNAESAETYGLELETKYAVCSHLDLMASAGWTHARLTEYNDPVTGANYDDNIPPFVPEFDAAIAADFHLDNGFFARVEYLLLGDTKFDDLNNPQFVQDSFGLLNATAGVRTERWTASVFATNLTGEEYYTNMNPAVFTGAPGAPREFGFKLGVRF